MPGDRKVCTADPILIDMGCRYEGYCSDMSRTIFMGCILEEIKPVYDLVLKNQLMVKREMKEGAVIKTIAKAVENDFSFNKFDFIHSLGHGIGLETHEWPYINIKSEAILRENMIVSNEPGIYIPRKYGIRIEDTVLITKNGSIQLTNSEKNYIVI